MKLIKQPENSNLCGQACVAMLLGISLEESIELIGKKGKTSLKHLKPAISSKYIVKDRERTTSMPIYSRVALLSIKFDYSKVIKPYTHWVVKSGVYIFDPAWRKVLIPQFELTCRGRVTSMIPLIPLPR